MHGGWIWIGMLLWLTAAPLGAAEGDPTLGARLAPELIALLAGGSPPQVSTRGGAVRVVVRLRPGSPDVFASLERAGLEIDVFLPGTVAGEISLARLRDLARLDAVERVDAG